MKRLNHTMALVALAVASAPAGAQNSSVGECGSRLDGARRDRRHGHAP